MADDLVDNEARRIAREMLDREAERLRDRTLEHSGVELSRSPGAFHWECEGCSTAEQNRAADRDNAAVAGFSGQQPFNRVASDPRTDARRSDGYVIHLPRQAARPHGTDRYVRLCRRCAVRLAVAIISDEVA